MKKISKFLALAALLLSTSCSDILDEQPRSFYTPEFFSTEEGIQGGLTSLYAHLRYIYGQGYYYNIMTTGTDEATYGPSADGNFKDADLSGVGNLNASTSRSDVLWGIAFSNINTCSGIIENATNAGMSDALIAEARFFRAFDYFKLVQTFGGVPLDMGAGELKFNTTPARTSVRNTVPEVYTKAIFPDLIQAVQDLPEVGRVTGGVTKTLARLYLAKAYLTYAWWLENPKNIPTYPEASRQDPDGKSAAQYFQMAYDIAVEAIENPGPFGLQPTYYDVNVASNDRNNEILLYADHTQDSEFYNASSLSWSNGNAPENFAHWMINWNYQTLRIGHNADLSSVFEPIGREAVQGLSRPWTRMAPTHEALATFTDKAKDSRYDGTFMTVYRGNWDKKGDASLPATAYAANGMPVAPGDAILTFLPEEDSNVNYANPKNNVGAGVLPGRADFVINPSGVSRVCFPGPWKIGGHRTDNGAGLGSPNGASTRPYAINKFSELYFVAAEAAVKGATVKSGKSARELLNVIRARAGKWSFSVAENQAYVADFSEELVAATPATITIDYILDERMREFYGEGQRWFELVRTQTWKERAGSYTIAGSDWKDKTPKVYNRTIENFHYLRPIPQGQLDGMEMTPEEKDAYQNPGYN
ncbi:MAG: RagB/SusD family nutrient uptake outer membrane protein [Alistipes sp.]|nr:RagB/SusD family nutrient uptake outer membrane protein [Alistipes sp.]